MKLKGITKLILAGTALAATAATLTTSTYAWYVTNNKVEATGVSGATAGSSVAGSLLISALDSANHTDLPAGYTTSIVLDTSTQADLNPMSKATVSSDYYYFKTSDSAKDSEKTYYKLVSNTYTPAEAADTNMSLLYERAAVADGTVWVDKEGKRETTPTMVTFQFWLKASSTMNGITVQTTFANSATAAVADALKQTFYSGTGLPTGMKAKDTFAVDAVYALRMEVTQQAYDLTYAMVDDDSDDSTPEVRDYTNDAMTANGNATVTVAGAVENHNATHDNQNQYASPKYNNGTSDVAIFNDHTGGDANVYYKSVMKTAGYGTDATLGTSPAAPGTGTQQDPAWTTIDLAKDVDTLITIKIWLEGTDAQCWDSCVGQNFTLNLKFEKAA